MRIVLFFMLLQLTQTLPAQTIVKKDLQAEWLTYDSAYRKFDNAQPVKTVYIKIPVKQFHTDYFIINAADPVSVLLNNVLIADQVSSGRFSIDSLAKHYPTAELFIVVHSENPINQNNLTTQIISVVLHQATSTEEYYLKTTSIFRDYVITAVLVMIIFLVTIIRLNPGLSSDYFSIRKIFSWRESEDDHYYYRVTSATILFYVFTSLLISLYILIIARFTHARLGMMDNVLMFSYGKLIFAWLKISLYVLLFLLAKGVIINVISVLFGIREIAAYHFFNFVRILLVTIGVFTLVLLLYFILHGQEQGFYNFLYTAILWIMGCWIVLGFFKLASRLKHSAFHLFSYICATELIPFFILIEVLNK